MNDISPSPFHSTRKVELRRKISEAVDFEEERYLSFLEAKWVHRYGLETLPEAFQENLSLGNDPICDKAVSSSGNFYPSVLHEEIEFLEEPVKNELLFDEEVKDLESELVIEPLMISSDLANEFNSQALDNFKEVSTLNTNNCGEENRAIKSKVAPTPPPRPTLNGLRRWLPSIEEDTLPKAS